MSKNYGKGGKVELRLKLNLSPPRASREQQSSSPPSSCLTAETEEVGYSSNPEEAAASAMVLVGCPRCLMYVMFSGKKEPRCPRCKSTALLDFPNDVPPCKRIRKH